MMKYGLILFLVGIFGSISTFGQGVTGRVLSRSGGLEFATLYFPSLSQGATTDSLGFFQVENLPTGTHRLVVSHLGYRKKILELQIPHAGDLEIKLSPLDESLEEIVVSGTLQEVSRSASPVPIEVYSEGFFKANPAPSLFESLQTINGVRPQVNCTICNTGDIHINGLEGPYTMVLLDGMPIVSGLSSVYGLMGIPQSLIDRIEVVKGPASTLYGSEAVGGLINVITKQPQLAPKFSVDAFGSSWSEMNLDIGLRSQIGSKVQSLAGANVFWYDRPIDQNGDGMTDLTQAKRISLFQKLSILRKSKKTFTMGMRYFYEDRWGGQMDWTSAHRGGDELYGESIYTSRWELIGQYELSGWEGANFQFSANGHSQNSVYGEMEYLADQRILFGQFTWGDQVGNHQFLSGLAYRYTYYDDNTPATFGENGDQNQPSRIHLPGLFVQDEIDLAPNHKLLLGLRTDYSVIHGTIFSPRANYKLSSHDESLTFRLSLGNGFRVANVFTEDHAALTGAREVVFKEELRPERSWNVNANLVKNYYTAQGNFLSLDGSVFYTHFTNQILPDYETNPNQIIYSNLEGHAVSRGLSLTSTFALQSGWEGSLGATLMDVRFSEGGRLVRQLLTERFSGVWNISYHFPRGGVRIDYSGNVYSPMRLPLLGDLDPRSAHSPWWSVQNIQLTKELGRNLELYGGVKNLLNFTPDEESIARAFDPFDKQVEFDRDGLVIPTSDNPHALTFDPSYAYASFQGIRGFLGIRWKID